MRAYSDKNISYFNGDCVSVDPDFEYDLLITDPPYGMNYKSNFAPGYKNGELNHDKIANDNCMPVELISGFIEKAKFAAYVFCRWDNLWQLPQPKSFIVWDKGNHSMGDLKREYGRQWEAIAFYPKDLHQWASGRPVDIIKVPRIDPAQQIHPNQKPVDLICRLISHCSGDVVFDPFCGVGTTLCAAKMMGKKAVGYEIDNRWIKKGVEMLSQEYLPL